MKGLLRTIGIFALAVLFSLYSCKHDGNNSGLNEQVKNIGTQGTNEGVVLLIAEADLIQLENKPQYNTAEWLLKVDKPGRYDVWLSLITIDSTSMHFEDNVIITAGETKLEKKPVGDHMEMAEKGINGHWYRADTHMGSVYFSQAGEYPIQVISDKVIAHASDLSQVISDKHTLINSVILKPKVN
jgi:hypothetical protein